MEACATAHYWAREISALGHEVRLMPPAYVKAYLRRQKNDAADAEAICEAVRRPTMRFVPAKGAERQAVLVLHRSRELLVRQRTMLINAIRGHCAEFGLIAAQGVCGSRDLIERVQQADSAVLPDMAKAAMMLLIEQLHALVRQIQELNRHLLTWHRQDQTSQRLATIPGVGVISATGLGRLSDRSGSLPFGPGVLCFAGPGSTPELVGRQGQAGTDLADGRSLPQKAARGRRDIGGAASADRRYHRGQLGPGSARAQTSPARHRGHGQQDRPDRLGCTGARRDLSFARRHLSNCGAHARPRRTVIPRLSDHDLCAQLRSPKVMMRQG